MSQTTPQTIIQKQLQLNRSTSGQWHLYASHRQEIERLLIPNLPGGRICVLGAGNCNDLDLCWLTQVYREVHLVDIDPEALARGAKFQKVSDSDNLRLHGSIDLTGLADRLSKWKQTPPSPEEIQTCLRLAGAPTASLAEELGGPFDVVLSPCVLSQLLMPLHDTIGRAHSAFMPMLATMRTRHFHLMFDLLAPGGRGVFACDLLSSVALPDLAQVSKEQLAGVMQKMLVSGKCFSGLESAAIAGLLTQDPIFSSRIAQVQIAAPWLWHLGLSKTYAVYAITFRRGRQ